MYVSNGQLVHQLMILNFFCIDYTFSVLTILMKKDPYGAHTFFDSHTIDSGRLVAYFYSTLFLKQCCILQYMPPV